MTKEKKEKPPQLTELRQTILYCLKKGLYRQSMHAIDRGLERDIDWPDVLYVLKNGYHEKEKTTFDEKFQVWKYAIRGKTIDNMDIRVIIAFDEKMMVIITVISVSKKLKEKS